MNTLSAIQPILNSMTTPMDVSPIYQILNKINKDGEFLIQNKRTNKLTIFILDELVNNGVLTKQIITHWIKFDEYKYKNS